MSEMLFSSFCPRCDREFTATTQKLADQLVRGHLILNDPQDEQHVDALEAWDDEKR